MTDKQLFKLVKEAAKGSTAAFHKIYDLKWKEVCFIALEMTGDMDCVQDIAQEVFIKVFKNIHTVNPPKVFKSWLSKIVRNTCIDYLRKQKTGADNVFEDIDEHLDTLEESNIDFLPESYFESQEKKEALLAEISSLSDEYRMIILMFYYQQLSLFEIAEATGSSEGAVKMRLSRARAVLKKKLDTPKKREEVLHSMAGLPLLTKFLQEQAAKAVPEVLEDACWTGVAEGLAAQGIAVGTASVTAAATGIPAAAKIAIASIAGAAVIGTGITFWMMSSRHDPPPEPLSPGVSSESDTSQISESEPESSVPSSSETSSETPPNEPPAASVPDPAPQPPATSSEPPVKIFADNTLEGMLGENEAELFRSYITLAESQYGTKERLEALMKETGVLGEESMFDMTKTEKYVTYSKVKGEYKLFIIMIYDEPVQSLRIDYRFEHKNAPIPDRETWD